MAVYPLFRSKKWQICHFFDRKHSLTDSGFQREIASLAALAKAQPEVERLMVVTSEEEACVEVSGSRIEVVPAYRFLLEY